MSETRVMAKVVVVGAGIVGASIAYHLTRRGAEVTIVDSGDLASGATRRSFAWIGAASGSWPGGAANLRSSVLTDHRRLEAELPDFSVRWTGSLAWSTRTATGPPPLLGPEQHVVGPADIAELEPNLRALPLSAVHTPSDGGVDPVAMTTALVRASQALGARVVLNSPVVSLRRTDGRITGVGCPAETFPASTVVLASGASSRPVSASLATPLPVSSSPALLIQASAPPGLVRGILATPEWEAREVRPGHLVLTAPITENATSHDLRNIALRTTRDIGVHFASHSRIQFTSMGIGMRPMPADDAPIIGRLTPDGAVYVAVMHSAVTLAPTVGRLVADEIIDGRPIHELMNSRPQRFEEIP
jgi:glycine/D-amino acid oxidase-like deaminating enzyme